MATSFLLTTLLCSTSMAATAANAEVSESILLAQLLGTDSNGSYSFDADKKEGSKSKAAPQPAVGKKEGSGSKDYPKKGHGMMHGKKEGSGKKYSGSRHGYKHKKGYAHKKKEGSGGHKYSHGAPHKGKHGHAPRGHGKLAHKGSHGKNPFKHVLCFTKKLGLTEAQVAEIKSKEFDFKKSRIQAKADHAIAHMELDRLVHSENIDEAKIRSVGDRITEIKAGKIKAMIEAKITILKILTPEQRKKMNQKHSGH